MSSLDENKYLEVIDSLGASEIKKIHKLTEILARICEEDSNVADLITIIYWNNNWNSKSWRTNSIESYMKNGMRKILDMFLFDYEEPDINCEYDVDSDIIDKMSKHTRILENILMFFNRYIHTRLTDSKKECYGIILTLDDNNNIELVGNKFKNEKDMMKSGYHNDAGYYLSFLNEYAVNCMYNSKDTNK